MKNLAEQCLEGGREQCNSLTLLVQRINARRLEIKGKPGAGEEEIWISAFVMEVRGLTTGARHLLTTIQAANSCGQLDRTKPGPDRKSLAAHDYEDAEQTLKLEP